MKRGLESFTVMQVGALRVSIASIVLFVFGFKHLKIINKKNFWYLLSAGIAGNFLPAFLFAKAQTELDSGITGILNSVVPIFTVILGIFVFNIKVKHNQILGIIIGFIGSAVLILQGASISPDTNFYYTGFVIAGSLSYAINSNIVKKYLYKEKAISITVSAFSMLLIPALIILINTGFFTEYNFEPTQNLSLFYIAILAVLGTSISVMMFNYLIQISSPVFATSVTYIIPIVAIAWGFTDGEILSIAQLGGVAIILSGIYLVNKH